MLDKKKALLLSSLIHLYAHKPREDVEQSLQ